MLCRPNSISGSGSAQAARFFYGCAGGKRRRCLANGTGNCSGTDLWRRGEFSLDLRRAAPERRTAHRLAVYRTVPMPPGRPFAVRVRGAGAPGALRGGHGGGAAFWRRLGGLAPPAGQSQGERQGFHWQLD